MERVARNVSETCLVPSSINTTSALSLMVEFSTGFLHSSAFFAHAMNDSPRRFNGRFKDPNEHIDAVEFRHVKILLKLFTV